MGHAEKTSSLTVAAPNGTPTTHIFKNWRLPTVCQPIDIHSSSSILFGFPAAWQQIGNTMGFHIGDRDDVERGIRLFFRLIFLIVGTLILIMIFDKSFGMKPSLLSAVISGGIAGGLGHAAGSGVVALLNLIWPPGGKRRSSKSSKKESSSGKRRKRQSLRPIEDE